jgi:serine protease
VTDLVVRVSPGEHELIVTATQTSATIQGLDSETQYLLTVTSAAGLQLGIPSDPLTATTLAATALKPQATPGDVSSLIVTLKTDQFTESVVANASSDLAVAGVSVEDTQDLGAGNARIELSTSVSDSDAQVMIADLEIDPRIASVEVDRRVFLNAFPATPPDDTDWASNNLWGLYGTYGVGIASNKDAMNSIWTSTQGVGAVVAVLDTGSTVHPDLDANYVAGYDFVSANDSSSCRTGATNADGDYVATGTYGALGWDNNPLDPGDWTTVSAGSCRISNSSWHGTHVAGTVGAVANNGQYIAGVAPQAKIQPVRVLSFGGGYTSDISAAITWASGDAVGGVTTNATPADVINMSLGGTGICPTAMQTAINAAVGRGAVVVVSAGNSNADASTSFPANCVGVITVAALTSTGARASYSNFGSTVEIAAPGSGIFSTMNTGTTTPVGPTVTSYDGTSMAAPHVAGVAALLKSQNRAITPAEVLTRIQSTALAFPTGTVLDCTTSTCGAGVLRASALVPGISSLSPPSGQIAGGTVVTMTGTNLSSPTSVTFGGVTATVNTSTPTSITVTTPAGSAGAVAVAVTTAGGTSTTASGFTYIAVPSGGGGGGGGGGGSSSSSDSPSGGSSAAPDEISVTQPVDSSNQVSRPGEFSVVDGAGAPVSLRSAGLVPTGFSIQGSDWGVTGSGALNSTNQDLTPGNTITISGEGLQRLTTVGVYILSVPTWVGSGIVGYDNKFTTTFAVPALPPGRHTLQINVVQKSGAANSLAVGFVLTGTAAPAPQTPNTVGTVDVGSIITFRSGSAKLSKVGQTRLSRMAGAVKGANTVGTITAYHDRRGTAKSKRLANARAVNISSYLRTLGVSQGMTVTLKSGNTAALQRSAITRLSTAAAIPANNEQISSLIVRYKAGVSPTVNGAVRGANVVTGGLGSGMTLGRNLGLRMYRVDFARPVSLVDAQRAAAQLSRAPGVEFAEVDRLVTGSVTAN